jgi:hypothetical protein
MEETKRTGDRSRRGREGKQNEREEEGNKDF